VNATQATTATQTTRAQRAQPGVWAQLAGACLGGLALTTALLPGVAAAQTASAPLVEQQLYGTSQWGVFPIVNAAGAATPGFDNQTAQMTGAFAKNLTNSWTIAALQRTTLTSLQSAAIEVRLGQSGWQNDELVLEYSVTNWATATRLTTFSASTPPPTALTTYTFAGLERTIATPAQANAVAVRLRGGARSGGADTITVQLDQVRLAVRGA
jgi:hypothetical protein